MGFLHDYLYYNECNEAHTNYHIWSAFVALASTIGRRVWIDYGHQYIYPHIYIVLVGPPGNRKSTAMFISKKLMRDVGTTYFAAQLESSEGLIKQMASNEVAIQAQGKPITFMPLTICVGELKDFLGVSMVKMINFTTAVWDQDYYDYKTRNKEDLVITNPYLCILACDTPAWITARLRDDIISGGFSRRTLFVFETEKAREIPFPVVTPLQQQAWQRCVDHCKSLTNISGQFIWTPAGKEFFSHWYLTKPKVHDLSLHGYYDSKHVLVLKIAMLVALSEAPKLVIDVPHLQTAMKLLEQVELKLPQVFEGLGRNELTQVSTKIVQLLKMHGKPMKEKELRAIMWKDAMTREFNDVMAFLQNNQTIIQYEQGAPPYQKLMVVLKDFAPPAVLQLLSRADGSTQGSSTSTGQPSQPPVAAADSQPQLPVDGHSALTVSDEGIFPFQKPSPDPGTSEK